MTYTITNAHLDRATGRIETIHIPWPADTLGEYGSGMHNNSPVSPAACDRAMDIWVGEHLDTRGMAVLSITAGRAVRGRNGRFVPSNSPDLLPCVIVSISDPVTAAGVAACVREGRRAEICERRTWIDGAPAS